MNVLEMIITLSVLASLSLLAVGSYRDLLVKTQVREDARTVQTALAFTREQGLIQGHASVSCEQSACVVKTQHEARIFLLSNKNSIVTQAFPKQQNTVIEFKRRGVTAIQNGSIFICATNMAESKHGMRVVFNQGGRVYLSSVVDQACA